MSRVTQKRVAYLLAGSAIAGIAALVVMLPGKVRAETCSSVTVSPLDNESITTTCTPVEPPPGNQAPVAVADEAIVMTMQQTSGNVLDNDSDPDDDPITVVQPNADIAADGSFSLSQNVPGTRTIDYDITDGRGGFTSSTLTVNFINRSPLVSDETASGMVGDTLSTPNVLANDSDQDGGTLIVEGSTNSLIAPDGSWAFQSATAGTFDFFYNVEDGQGGDGAGKLTITIEEPPPPPPSGLNAFIDPTDGNVPFVRTTVTHADETRKLAFPSAQGHGKFADPDIGPGQSFQIYKVTNLNNSGAGSFRDCWMATTGPRVCIFTVSGTIGISSEMLAKAAQSNVYVAGQTSPGGVQFSATGGSGGRGPIRTQGVSDLIMRFVKSRPGTGVTASADLDAFSIGGETAPHDIILDHVTAQWGADETLDFSNLDRATIQWSLQSEPLACGPCRSDGNTSHDYGILTKGNASNMTLHHNIWMSNKLRSPNVAADGYDFINNVVYNYGDYAGQLFVTNNKNMIGNFVGNWYSRGPRGGNMNETGEKPHAFYVSRDPQGPPANLGHELYFDNNICAHDFSGNNDLECVYQNPPLIRPNGASGSVFFSTPRDGGLTITPTTPQQAWKDVMAFAGARQDMHLTASGRSDAVEQRSLNQLANCENHSYSPAPSIISAPPSPGYPNLSGTATWSWGPDADNDGMMDSWEVGHFGNTSQPANGDPDADGWSNLEEFLNYLAGEGFEKGNASGSVPAANCGWPAQ